jgi:hypothetical protein
MVFTLVRPEKAPPAMYVILLWERSLCEDVREELAVFTLSHSQGLKASEVDEGVHGDGGDLIVAKVSVHVSSNKQDEKQRCKSTASMITHKSVRLVRPVKPPPGMVEIWLFSRFLFTKA